MKELYLIVSQTHHMNTLPDADTAKAVLDFLDESMPGHGCKAKPVKLQFDLILEEPEAEFRAFVSH